MNTNNNGNNGERTFVQKLWWSLKWFLLYLTIIVAATVIMKYSGYESTPGQGAEIVIVYAAIPAAFWLLVTTTTISEKLGLTEPDASLFEVFVNPWYIIGIIIYFLIIAAIIGILVLYAVYL